MKTQEQTPTENLFITNGLLVLASSQEDANARYEQSSHAYHKAMAEYDALNSEETTTVEELLIKHGVEEQFLDRSFNTEQPTPYANPYTSDECAFLNGHNIENFFVKDHITNKWMDMSHTVSEDSEPTFDTVEELYDAYIIAKAMQIISRK